MNQLTTPSFWKQWDVEVLNYQIVALLNILAGLFLTAMWHTFDFTKIIDLANWQIADFYIFLGPIIAQAISVLLVDSATWLVGYDFGVSNEMVIYWGLLIVNTVVQIAGNGTSVALIGIYALIGLLILAVSAVVPVVAISNPITLVMFVLFSITVLGPILVDIAGFFLFGSFIVLSVALVFDNIYLMFTNPDMAIYTLVDVFEHGLASPYVQDWEDTVEQYFGTGFSELFGTSIIRDYLDHIELHIGLQMSVVFPLAVLLTIGKLIALVASFIMMIFGFNRAFSGPGSFNGLSDAMLYGGMAIAGYFIVFDGALASLVDTSVWEQLYPSQNFVSFFTIDLLARSFIHSMLTLEADYWGIYFLVRLIQKWTDKDSDVLAEYTLPEVGQGEISTFGDIVAVLTPDNIEKADFKLLQTFNKPVIIAVLMPLLQGLTWAYQYPFFMEMSYHIRGVADLA